MFAHRDARRAAPGYLRIAARGKMGGVDLYRVLDEGRKEKPEVSGALSGEGGALCATRVWSSKP
jgi:hypothetical protein